jgi:hypothetical protein
VLREGLEVLREGLEVLREGLGLLARGVDAREGLGVLARDGEEAWGVGRDTVAGDAEPREPGTARDGVTDDPGARVPRPGVRSPLLVLFPRG